jgi:hypothetical protein
MKMKYQITHKCGHEVTLNLTGPFKERESRIEWLKNHDCTECYRKAARANAKAENMVELQGTEKQIAWAETIRAKKLDQIANIVEDDEDRAALAAIKAETESRYWIDRRDTSAQAILTEAIQKIKAAAYEQANPGMRALEGTTEQVAEAENIRARILAEINELIDSAKPHIAAMPAETKTHFEASCKDAENIAALISAAWWLENKHNSGKAVLQRVGELRIAATK